MTAPFTKVVPDATFLSLSPERAGSVHEMESIPPELILMDRLVDLLIQKAKTGIHWPDLYERATSILRSLRLPTRSELLAAKRLRNAERYASDFDFGAATFELRLVRTQLA